jgi:undecaprenyl-diphosphatase
LPAAIAGLAFHSRIKALLFNPLTVAVALVLGALVILAVERWYSRQPAPRVPTVDDMTWKDALKVGLAQCFALIPGTSRSGSTIMGGMIFGLSRQAATQFSFFLAVPIMFAATGYEMFKSRHLFEAADVAPFATGFAAAFVAALLAVRTLIRYVANHDYRGFAWYRIALGVVVLAYFY